MAVSMAACTLYLLVAAGYGTNTLTVGLPPGTNLRRKVLF